MITNTYIKVLYSHEHTVKCNWPQCSYTFDNDNNDIFQHVQFHLNSELLYAKSLQVMGYSLK